MIPSESRDWQLSFGPPEIPEHMMVLLLEAAQQFLAQAQVATEQGEPLIRDHRIKKVLAILEELNSRLNPDGTEDLALNLSRLYHWWGEQILVEGHEDDAERLRVVAAQMGEIRKAWEQVLFNGVGLSENPEF